MFEGEKVRIRSLELSDCDYIWEHFNNLELRHYMGKAMPMSREETKKFIEQSWENRKNGFQYLFAFDDKKTNQFLGCVNLVVRNKISNSADLGIWIYEGKYRDKGYGTDAMKVILSFGFDYLNLHRIELEVYPTNTRAIRVYEKIGFKKVGQKRESRFMNGEYKDSVVMDILRSEWINKTD
ncbi:MAG: GNAT family N-acetyltransferase [Asgard group archaeon]|nr:GNAT family N-acetyltransferase [Asgard group archaeon]